MAVSGFAEADVNYLVLIPTESGLRQGPRGRRDLFAVARL